METVAIHNEAQDFSFQKTISGSTNGEMLVERIPDSLPPPPLDGFSTDSSSKATSRVPSVTASVTLPDESTTLADTLTLHTDDMDEIGETVTKTFTLTGGMVTIPDVTRESSKSPDLAMTEEEIEAWETMMQRVQDDISKRKEDFEKWGEEMTRRRMIAMSKISNINKLRNKRTKFYEVIKEYISDMESKLNATDLEKQKNNLKPKAKT